MRFKSRRVQNIKPDISQGNHHTPTLTGKNVTTPLPDYPGPSVPINDRILSPPRSTFQDRKTKSLPPLDIVGKCDVMYIITVLLDVCHKGVQRDVCCGTAGVDGSIGGDWGDYLWGLSVR